jgi:hypothetical protein
MEMMDIPAAIGWFKDSAELMKVLGKALEPQPEGECDPLDRKFVGVLLNNYDPAAKVITDQMFLELPLLMGRAQDLAALQKAQALYGVERDKTMRIFKETAPPETPKSALNDVETVLKKAALSAASADPTITPLQFLLGVMRDQNAPTGLRVQAARAAAPLVHGKLRAALGEGGAGKANAIGGSDGFSIDIAEAKTFRDMEHRLAILLRKQFGPSENGGPLTAEERLEESELRVIIKKRAAALVCPPHYGPQDAMNDSDRLHQLHCKRLSPPSCGGGELKGAEDEEEALLTARVAAYRHSPEGRARQRMLKLKMQDIGDYLDLDERKELDQLEALYPESTESALGKAIQLKLAELGYRSK